MHEHLWLDISFRARDPRDPAYQKVSLSPVSMELLGLIRDNPHICRDNLRLDNEGVIVQELSEFKRVGGRTIVEQTLEGLGRNATVLKQVSKLSGVNVVASTGWYIHASHPTFVRRASAELLADIMISEIEEGIGETGVKAGLIGECAASTPEPYHNEEKKVLAAASKAQVKTGVAFTFHQEYLSDLPQHGKAQGAYEPLLQIIEREGADLSKFFLSHSQRSYFDLEYQCQLMDKGITLCYDCFDFEYYYNYSLTAKAADWDELSKTGDWRPTRIGKKDISDTERVQGVAELCRRGYDKHLLLSHDICHKTELKKFGGNGYSYILETIVPWLKQEGVRDSQIRTMLVENPRRLLMR